MSREQRYIDSIWHDAEERMREKAEAEIATCDDRFIDWLGQFHDMATLAPIIAAAAVVAGAFARDVPAWDNLRAHADRLQEDYWRHRCESKFDMDDLYADAESDAAEACQSRMEDMAEGRGFEGLGR